MQWQSNIAFQTNKNNADSFVTNYCLYNSVPEKIAGHCGRDSSNIREPVKTPVVPM